MEFDPRNTGTFHRRRAAHICATYRGSGLPRGNTARNPCRGERKWIDRGKLAAVGPKAVGLGMRPRPGWLTTSCRNQAVLHVAKRQMSLALLTDQATGTHPTSWIHPDTNVAASTDIDHFRAEAQLAERGKFDMCMLRLRACARPHASPCIGIVLTSGRLGVFVRLVGMYLGHISCECDKRKRPAFELGRDCLPKTS
jgi:hypothetical protein